MIEETRGRKRLYDYDMLDVGQFILIAGKKSTDIAGSIALARKRNPGRIYKAITTGFGVKVIREK